MNMTEKIQTYLNDPKIVSVNTVDAHSDHKYFESLEEFSEGEMKLRQSLNGKWKIHYAQNTNQVLKDFYKTEFDETDLNFIQCTRSFRASRFWFSTICEYPISLGW